MKLDKGSLRLVPKWIHTGAMAKTAKTVTLSVKNVPADLAKRLKERAARNNRSLQGELLEILDDASRYVTLDDVAEIAKKLGLKSDRNESTQIIREDRDARSR